MAEPEKKREVQVGLANNLFGAAAGGVATAQAGVAARNAWKNRNLSPEQQKAAAAQADKKPSAARRVLRKLPKGAQKPLRAAAKSRWTVPALAVGNVGMQLANGGMDGQSAHYFGRELRDIKREEKKPVKKSQSLVDIYEGPARGDGVGTNLNVPRSEPVSKEILYAQPREANPNRKRNNQVAAAAGVGSVGAAGYGAKQFRDINEQVGRTRRSLTQMEEKTRIEPTLNRTVRETKAVPRKIDVRRMSDPVQEAKRNVDMVFRDPSKSRDARAMYSENPKASKKSLAAHSKKFKRGRNAAIAAAGLAGAATLTHKVGGGKERNRWT